MTRPDPRMLGLVCAAALAFSGCGGGGAASSSTAVPAGGSPYGSKQGATSTASAGAQATMVLATKRSGKLGRILAAGPKKLTVYLFEADKNGQSACSGACAAAWPPVTASGKATAASGALASRFGVISRADGSRQLTYNGHPLYYYIKDKDSGDAYGEGLNAFGGAWYALNVKGSKVDLS